MWYSLFFFCVVYSLLLCFFISNLLLVLCYTYRDFRCLVRAPDSVKVLPHSSHLNGRSPIKYISTFRHVRYVCCFVHSLNSHFYKRLLVKIISLKLSMFGKFSPRNAWIKINLCVSSCASSENLWFWMHSYIPQWNRENLCLLSGLACEPAKWVPNRNIFNKINIHFKILN